MSSFILKLIAMISMVFDHSGYLIFHGFSFFNYIGRLAFPIFAFQIGEGYHHTKNVKNYFLRLFFFAIISQIPYMLYQYAIGRSFSLNILFTLCLGLFTIILYDKAKNKIIGFLGVLLIAIIGHLLQIDYGAFGIAIIFLFYFFKNNKVLMTISYLIACLLKYLPDFIQYQFYYKYVILCVCTMLAIFLICLYNGKKGKNVKYLLYFFYPFHLFILFIVSLLNII